jgi:putative flippase GtrA
VSKLLKFFAAGLPSFLIAIPLNWVLVTRAGWPKPAAYAVVLALQVTVNYFACRYFVFDSGQGGKLWKSFAVFVNGILLFRLLDWGLYSLLTTRFGLPFIGVQLFNVALFGLLKFEFSRRVFERRKPLA